ncbi:MAG: nucleotidyl transferase AbiEii/AbiGii toxin family protein [Candidatus Peregrinibacteria bacterium]|nr:nucleotidyl transferase AbiEii/AbiGii toxin family protein [Candidatus Peregrinibacteria bacterium]
MQNLTKIIKEAKKNGIDDNGVLNLVREYLQVLILKAIYQSKYGSGLSFMGGTCLRICHDLKRYSEDLDFAFDKKIQGYSFQELNEIIVSFLKNTDFEVDLKVSEDKVVQKSFIRVGKVLHLFGLSPLESQKIHVKLEIDTNPVKVGDNELETFFVNKFNEMFPILKHSDGTLFAGKVCAVFNREYIKGRDFYDLLWYLNRKEKINLGYLNRAMKQAGVNMQFKDDKSVIERLGERVQDVKVQEIMKDLGRFLEDAGEEKIFRNYHAAYAQAVNRYLKA